MTEHLKHAEDSATLRRERDALAAENARLREALSIATRQAGRQRDTAEAERHVHAAQLAASEGRTAEAEADARSGWRRAAAIGAELGRRVAEHDARLLASRATIASLERANEGLSADRAAAVLHALDLDAIVESAIDCAIVTTDLEGRVLSWNSGAGRLLGWWEEAPIARLDSAFAAEDAPALAADLALVRAGQRVSREGWVRHRNGARLWAGIEAMPLRTEEEEAEVGMLWMLRDRSAAHRAEAVLREQEAKYRTLFESMDEAYCVIEMLFDAEWRPEDYRFLEVNAAFARHTGLHDATGRRVREMIPAHEAHWFEIYGRIALSGVPERFESHAAALGRWFDVYAFRVGEPGDHRVAVLFTDITARRQVQDALRESEARLRGVLEGMAEGFGLLAPDFTILEHNAQALRMDGRAREEIIGRSHWEVYPGTADSELGRLLKHAMAARVPVALEHCYAFEGGHSLWLDMRAYPTADGALAVFWRDVTDRKAAEAALQEKEHKYRSLFESMDEGYLLAEVLFDAEDRPSDIRYLEANAAAIRMIGADPTGRLLRELDPGYEPHWYEIWGRVARSGRGERLERFAAPTGTWYDFYVFKPEPEDPQSRRVAVVFQDVTARRQAEEGRAFLLDLSDALRPLSDPLEVQRTAMRLLAAHLGVSRAAYFEMEEDGDTFGQAAAHEDDTVPLPARMRVSDYGPEILAAFRSGRSMFVRDTEADPRSEAQREAYRAIGVRAWAGVPLVKDGRLLAVLGVHSRLPRDWTANELQLLEQVAERSWAAVERARAEAALRVSEERFRSFAETSIDAIYVVDARSRRLEYLSPGFERIWGEPRAAILRDLSRWGELVHPEDREEAIALQRRFHADPAAGPFVTEYRILRPDDGTVRHIFDTAVPIRDATGEVVRIAGIARDVTARRVTEAALRENEQRYRSLVANIPQLVFRMRGDGAWLWVSPQWTRFTGFSEAQSLGDGWLEAVHPEDREATRQAWAAAAGRGVLDVQLRIRDAAAQGWRWFQARATPLRDEQGSIFEWIGTATDIEDQMQAREVLASSRDQLETLVEARTAELMAAEANLRQAQKMEAIGQLTGGIAHDFNNMLQGVSGAIEMARRRLAADRAPEAGRYLDAAQDAAGRAAGLTRRLLAFARRHRLEPQQLEPDRQLAGLAELVRRTVGPAIALELRLEAAGEVVDCDPGELDSAVLNLCINARDAMPGGGRLTIATRRVDIGAEELFGQEGARPGPHVEILVGDEGTGMPPEVLERAFEPFFTTKPLGQGTGLGLSQVYGFVRQSGGVLRIDSRAGMGTRVRLWLPAVARREAGAAAPDRSEEPPAAAPGTLLLVDDEQGVRGPAAARLREAGHRVVEAEDGAAALRLIEGGLAPDLLVTDIGLPGELDGVRLVEAARALRPDLAVLFVTGYPTAALPAGAQVIGKPFALDQLSRRVQALLRRGR